MKNKIVAFALLIFMLMPLCCACNQPDASPGSSDSTSNDASNEPALEERLNMDVDYGGMDFKVFTTAQGGRTPTDFEAEDNQKIMDIAVNQKNAIMERDYGIVIHSEHSFGTSNGGYAKIFKQYSSSESEYSLCILASYDAANLALEGCFHDINSFEEIDTTDPWWDQAANRDLAIAGSLFFTQGSLSTIIDDFTYCVVFNKAIYKTVIGDTSELYQKVADGKWTLDELGFLARTVKDDMNGDDVMDSRDRYGLMIWDNELIASLNASGNRIASLNDEGMVEYTLYNEVANATLEKFITTGNSDYSINFQHMTGGVAWYNMFTQDQVLMLMSMFNEVERFRDMRTDYGIIPNPKYSEAQSYYAPVSLWHGAFICIPYMVENADDVANIVELLGYHSMKLLTPAYYDKTLKGLYVRDDESAEMLDIIFANRIYDVGHIYKIGSINEHITNLLRNNQPTGLSSVYEQYRTVAESDIRGLNIRINTLKNQ